MMRESRAVATRMAAMLGMPAEAALTVLDSNLGAPKQYIRISYDLNLATQFFDNLIYVRHRSATRVQRCQICGGKHLHECFYPEWITSFASKLNNEHRAYLEFDVQNIAYHQEQFEYWRRNHEINAYLATRMANERFRR